MDGKNTSTNKTNTQSTFGQRFQSLRKQAKLSLSELAAEIGHDSPETIVLLENNTELSTIRVLRKIHERFGIDLHELITGRVSPAVSIEVESLRKIKHELRLTLASIRAEIKDWQKETTKSKLLSKKPIRH